MLRGIALVIRPSREEDAAAQAGEIENFLGPARIVRTPNSALRDGGSPDRVKSGIA